jgi:prepilin-type N-terminal cleavage/methylation domain-containing protein
MMRRNRERGFTIVETLVALAILALALTSFYQLTADSLQGTSNARLQIDALGQAETLLERLGVEVAVISANGKFGNEMFWRLEVAPLSVVDPQTSKPTGAWVVVTVQDRRGRTLARVQTAKIIARSS